MIDQIIMNSDYYSYTLTKTLDDNVYELAFDWNSIENTMSMDIKGLSNSVDTKNIKLVTGVNLFAPYGLENILGALVLVDLTGANREPTFDNITTEFELLYRSL